MIRPSLSSTRRRQTERHLAQRNRAGHRQAGRLLPAFGGQLGRQAELPVHGQPQARAIAERGQVSLELPYVPSGGDARRHVPPGWPGAVEQRDRLPAHGVDRLAAGYDGPDGGQPGDHAGGPGGAPAGRRACGGDDRVVSRVPEHPGDRRLLSHVRAHDQCRAGRDGRGCPLDEVGAQQVGRVGRPAAGGKQQHRGGA
jgi:hypothetical protein